MHKTPGYNFETKPYIFIKEARFVSILNVKEKAILPLIRSPYDMDPLSVHNFAVFPYYDRN